MALEILPPSPNWYLSSANSCSEDGIFAFVTKSSILLLDVTVSPPTFAGNLSGHTERVTSVAFCRATGTGGRRLCATAGDDGFIKIWDIKSKSVFSEKKCQENKITSLDWSRANPDIVVVGDEKGCLIIWDIKSSKKDDTKLLKPDKGCIYSLACNPHDSRIVALGYKDGKILIVDVLSKKNQIQHHLRGHNDEVQSLTWAPYLGEDEFLKNRPEDEDTDKPVEPGCLLVSGSRDKTIRMWSTGQGKLLKVMNLPPRGGGGQWPRDRGDEGVMKSRVWIALYWPQDRPTQLVSSSHGGDVILWDLSKPSQPRWEILGGPGDSTHQRSVFNINGRQGDLDRVITTSMDRQVICWNLSTLQSEWSLPTLGGFVYCISPSPLDPARLALGVGDNMIRVWNTGARGRMYDVTTLWQGIKSKVTVVSWHPLRENSLAYGTDDGRVGIFNVSVPNKPPQQFWTFHKKTIYSLCWGPPCPKPDGSHSQSHHVYSCGGEGIVYQHNPAKLEQESTNINVLIKQTNNYNHLLPQRSDVAWRLDGRAVAIGNEDGSIEVFASPDLHHLCTAHVQGKIINCLSWYPDYEEAVQSGPEKFESHQSEMQDSVPSKPLEVPEQTESEKPQGEGGDQDACSSTVAVDSANDALSKETGVSLLQETSVTLSEQTGVNLTEETSEILSEKTGNGLSEKTGVEAERNASEKRYWLASGSNDHEVEIYDLANVLGDKGEPLTIPITSSYRTLTGHTGRVTSLTWSPHGDGRLVSTSYDNSAQVWDVVKGEPLANFRGHMGRVFSCSWSCFDPDLVMTGGEDFCLMKWQVSKVNHIKPPKSSRKPFKRTGKKGKKTPQPRSQNNQEEHANDDGVVMTTDSSSVDVREKQKEIDMATVKTEINVCTPSTNQASEEEGNNEIDDAKQLLERKKRELLAQVEEIEGRIEREKESNGAEYEDDQVTAAELSNLESNQQEVPVKERNDALAAILDRLAPKEEVERDQDKGRFKDMTVPGTKKGRHKRIKSLFPLSSSQDNRGKAFLQQDCIDLAKLKQGVSLDERSGQPPLQLGSFVDRKMAMKMLNDEASQHGESGNFDQRCQLNLWKGNILQPLREAIKKGQLTDWLVAMAPLAGHDVWLQTCDAYAKQLESQDQIHRAVSFYLLSHQVYKAIAILKKNSMFRDAITLAQVRLLPSDPVLHDLYLTWANQLEGTNSYEPAARCYLALNQPVNAIKLLTRKGDVPALGTALHVAILSGCTEEGLVVSIATRFLNLSLVTGQWKHAVDIFLLDKKYQVHASLVLVYEILVWCLIHEGCLIPNHDINYTDIHYDITPGIQWNEPSDGSNTWSIPTLNGAPLVKALLARPGLSCDKSHDLQCLKDGMSYDLAHDINKVLRYAAQQILLGQSSGEPEDMGRHVAKAVLLCHTSGYPAVAVSILQITMPQDAKSAMMSPSNQVDINEEMVSLSTQYGLTKLYHVRRRDGPPEKDKAEELQSVQDGDLDGLLGKPKEDGQVEDDVIKKQVSDIDDDDGGVMLNHRTERYLFQRDILKDTSWPLCLPTPVALTSSGDQTLTQKELAARILQVFHEALPSHGYNKNDNESEISCLEIHSGGDRVTIASPTLPIFRTEIASSKAMSSEASNDNPDKIAVQNPQPNEQAKSEAEGSQPNNGQTVESLPSLSAVQNPLDKDPT